MRIKEHYQQMKQELDEPLNFEYRELINQVNPFSFFENLTYLNLPPKKDKRIRREYKKYIELFGEVNVFEVNKNIHLSESYPTHHSKRDAIESMVYYIDYLDLNKPLIKAKDYHVWLKEAITAINSKKKYVKNLKKKLDDLEQKE